MTEERTTAVATIGDLKQTLEKAMPKFAEVAQKHVSVDRLIRLALAAVSRTPKLLQCSKESVLLFCMKCAETGLPPIGPGGAWAVPYENRKTGKVEMQFIPDYRGLINCAKSAGAITDAWAEIVREGDAFDLELGMNPTLMHKPARSDRGALQGAYCIVSLPNGDKRPVYMDAREIAGIRSRSRAGSSGPWVTDESEMWKKTVVRRAMKPFAGMSAALDAAIDADDAATGVVDRDPIRDPLPLQRPAESSQRTEAAGEAPPAQEPENSAAPSRDDLLREAKRLILTAPKGIVKRSLGAVGLTVAEDLETATAEQLADFSAKVTEG